MHSDAGVGGQPDRWQRERPRPDGGASTGASQPTGILQAGGGRQDPTTTTSKGHLGRTNIVPPF